MQRGVDLNVLSLDTMKYLYNDNNNLFQKKDIPFIQDTLLKLGSGGLMSIQSTNPTKKRFDLQEKIEALQIPKVHYKIEKGQYPNDLVHIIENPPPKEKEFDYPMTPQRNPQSGDHTVL